MARKSAAEKREVQPDPKFNDIVVTKFVNVLLRQGQRAVAEGIFYTSLKIIEEKIAGEDALKVFKKALENLKPVLEVKSRRVGGATYQVPVEVKPARRQALASRWLVKASRSRNENSMAERLAAEMLEAAAGRGNAIKAKDDVHRMAEANKAFAHFRW